MTLLRDIADITQNAAAVCGVVMQNKIQEQSRQLKIGIARLVFKLAILKIGVLLVAAGLGFLLWGVYRMIAAALNPTASALILGGSIVLIGLVLGLIVKRSISQS